MKRGYFEIRPHHSGSAGEDRPVQTVGRRVGASEWRPERPDGISDQIDLGRAGIRLGSGVWRDMYDTGRHLVIALTNGWRHHREDAALSVCNASAVL